MDGHSPVSGSPRASGRIWTRSEPAPCRRLPRARATHEFKYVLTDSDGRVEWESGPNRVVNVSAAGHAALDPADPLPHRVRHHLNQRLGAFELVVHHTCSRPAHVVAVVGDAEVSCCPPIPCVSRAPAAAQCCSGREPPLRAPPVRSHGDRGPRPRSAAH